MSETRLKIKNIGVGFIQIGAAKSHHRAIRDFWKAPKMAVGCILNANIFFILSLVTLIFFYLDDKINIQDRAAIRTM
jgi:hypothetical protein